MKKEKTKNTKKQIEKQQRKKIALHRYIFAAGNETEIPQENEKYESDIQPKKLPFLW